MAQLAVILPVVAFAIVGVASVWLYCMLLFRVDIFWWMGDVRNIFHRIRRLPGRGFVRATREWEVFSVSYIRPAVYDFVYSLKEGRINSRVHSLLRTPKRKCPICLDSTFRHRFPKFKCGHYACVYCIREYLSEEVDNGRSEFRCLVGEDCSNIEDRIIQRVTRLDWALRDKMERMYIRVGLAQCIDSFTCPTTVCGNAVFSDEHLAEEVFRKPKMLFRLRTEYITDESGSDLRRFKCENCAYSYCVLCSRVWEQGKRIPLFVFIGAVTRQLQETLLTSSDRVQNISDVASKPKKRLCKEQGGGFSRGIMFRASRTSGSAHSARFLSKRTADVHICTARIAGMISAGAVDAHFLKYARWIVLQWPVVP